MTTAATPAQRRTVLVRRVRLLVAATITYNVVEAVVALAAGSVASSAALLGFGLDSVIEVASAAVVAWQFAGRDPEAREKLALRLISASFVALAVYVSMESVRSLAGAASPEHSPVGIVLAAVSLVVMPWLSWAQRRAGRELGSASAVADSKQTLLCTYLSGVVLAGLVLNALFGWSWADPVAGLVIAVVALKEARDAWRGDTCCAPVMSSAATADEPSECRCATPTPSSTSAAAPGDQALARTATWRPRRRRAAPRPARRGVLAVIGAAVVRRRSAVRVHEKGGSSGHRSTTDSVGVSGSGLPARRRSRPAVSSAARVRKP